MFTFYIAAVASQLTLPRFIIFGVHHAEVSQTYLPCVSVCVCLSERERERVLSFILLKGFQWQLSCH